MVRPVAVPLAGNGGLAEATQCPGQHYDQRNDDALLKWALSGTVQVLCRITPTIIYFPNMYLSGTWVREILTVSVFNTASANLGWIIIRVRNSFVCFLQ